MIYVYLNKNGMQGSWGKGKKPADAIQNARNEYRDVWGGNPKEWKACVMQEDDLVDVVDIKKFSSWTELLRELKEATGW